MWNILDIGSFLLTIGMLFCLLYFFVLPKLRGNASTIELPKSSGGYSDRVLGMFFDEYVGKKRKHPYIYILDVRSEAESKKESFRDVNNIIVLVHPLDEPKFLGRVISDSRFWDMCESTKEIVVVCNDGTKSLQVCYALKDYAERFRLDFKPVHLEDGARKITRYLRYNPHAVESD